jgi:hypothetical protein
MATRTGEYHAPSRECVTAASHEELLVTYQSSPLLLAACAAITKLIRVRRADTGLR